MPRRQYRADLERACETSVAGILNVRQGEFDGNITLTCPIEGQNHDISLLILEVADYPSDHTCMIFGGESLPEDVADQLVAMGPDASGRTIHQILELMSRRLGFTDEDGDEQMMDLQDCEDEDEDEVEEFFPDFDEHSQRPFNAHTTFTSGTGARSTTGFRQRIRSDLLTVKENGFKVGYVGGLLDGGGCYVSISCRFSKLGISEEAMEAWQVRPSEYLTIIISYPNGYKSMETVTGYDTAMARLNFGVRVGISTTYKVTLQEAIHAFAMLTKKEEKRREQEPKPCESQASTTPHGGFRDAFISRPLNDLLKAKFPQLLRYRYNGMTWGGAEAFSTDHVGSPDHADLGLADKYMIPDNIGEAAYPSIVLNDHILDATRNQEHSLPLVSMQFVLRHFIRCTEFCLICFSKMPDDLQAIKPYVCDNPLCLFQYMTLGFGPSIEHEILSQPKVVDLLISFCYTSARSCKIKDFPTGLGLMVPPSSAYGGAYSNIQQQVPNAWTQPVPTRARALDINTSYVTAQNMRYSASTKEILFEDRTASCPVRPGDWVVIHTAENSQKALHCRVVDTALYPTVQTAEPVEPSLSEIISAGYGSQYPVASLHPAKPQASHSKVATAGTSGAPSSDFVAASFYMYNQNFDDLDDGGKREAIVALLDILPSVSEMAKYIRRKTQSSLSSWIDRMPPAALGVLRWIIASNRACIMQVADADEEAAIGRKGQDRLCGMPGWSQFRFAMGAPDKERKFIQAVRETTDRLKLTHSTLFAWHGSPLYNWHSIIREGLHFNDTTHGRAFGHGVYHSLECSTSIGYTGHNLIPPTWPTSELKVSQALALNEITNAPSEFVSKSPHLVVAQLDWIQTRYLFVKTAVDYGAAAASHAGNTSSTSLVNKFSWFGTKETKPFDPIDQDKNYTPRGVGGSLVIPKNALTGSRRPKPRSITVSTKNKRQKATGSYNNPVELDDDDDNLSIATLDEDLTIFYDEDVQGRAPVSNGNAGILTPISDKGKVTFKTGFFSKLKGKSSAQAPAVPLTDYRPGKLDYSTLPMLAQPVWATTQATRRLMRDFQDIIKVQNTSPQHELGWHIDEDNIENMYQWIVEMHSFDPKLPLAQDMKKSSCKSIVFELRFGKDYPISPPFVRVIRPRFLGFNQGGGGHVTLGGAMCMELLTNDGWSPVSTIEAVLLQVRVAITSMEPKPARLDTYGRQDYGVGEAVEAYIRACNVHGWTVPAGFNELAYGGA